MFCECFIYFLKILIQSKLHTQLGLKFTTPRSRVARSSVQASQATRCYKCSNPWWGHILCDVPHIIPSYVVMGCLLSLTLVDLELNGAWVWRVPLPPSQLWEALLATDVGFRKGNAYLAQGPACEHPVDHTGTRHPHSDDYSLKMQLLNDTDCELVELIFSGGGDCL